MNFKETFYFSMRSPGGGEGGGASIGTGSSDQGIEPGEENQEDEFKKDVPEPPASIDIDENVPYNDRQPDAPKENEGTDSGPSEEAGSGSMDKGYGGINTQPSHGLVEEGPGPDS